MHYSGNDVPCEVLVDGGRARRVRYVRGVAPWGKKRTGIHSAQDDDVRSFCRRPENAKNQCTSNFGPVKIDKEMESMDGRTRGLQLVDAVKADSDVVAAPCTTRWYSGVYGRSEGGEDGWVCGD
ncbi:hypothetical protein B0H16DRAFT_1448650 [Mycena metata]|uniref:Uncharacterized protein n=1 Tax=Mycena metata TaxID=1033252 RepID=A0AAD7K649_9AGAR|nr:hypothetical protein B0H16DRAFT_1448650 [Mycena metata]